MKVVSIELGEMIIAAGSLFAFLIGTFWAGLALLDSDAAARLDCRSHCKRQWSSGYTFHAESLTCQCFGACDIEREADR